MTKSIAFSVWPLIPGKEDEPPPILKRIRNITLETLKNEFDEIRVFTDTQMDDFSRAIVKKAGGSWPRYCTKISDYMRVYIIKQLLESGKYHRVYYFDYDLLVQQPPQGYGVAMEAHFETEEGSDKVVKWWHRLGVNCAYHVTPLHLPQISFHLLKLREIISKARGNPKYTYPMNAMWMIEEDIGYINDHFLLGAFNDPSFYTPENAKDIMRVITWMTGNRPETLAAINLMGSRVDGSTDDEHLNYLLAESLKLTSVIENLSSGDFTDEEYSRIAGRLKDARIRPNYNSREVRDRMKKFLEKAL